MPGLLRSASRRPSQGHVPAPTHPPSLPACPLVSPGRDERYSWSAGRRAKSGPRCARMLSSGSYRTALAHRRPRLPRHDPASQAEDRGNAMTSSPEPGHLSNHHRDTLRQIFQHPASHNIEWHAVMSLLEAVGTVTVHHDGKVAVKIGSEQEFLDPPSGKDIDTQMVVDLRRMLSNAGYRPSV